MVAFFPQMKDLCKGGVMVVADLTDPMLTPAEARSIFQVLLRQYRGVSLSCGKVVVFDEAHKYLSNMASNTCELTSSIIEVVRQTRHHGLRVVISTQDPKSLASHFLELVSVALVHRDHSKVYRRTLHSAEKNLTKFVRSGSPA
jgi:vacuolar-type H+-ATPase subunit E/Vma4